ncbi:DUF2570 family protein [Serratia liquefaciens]|uniref:DUF2570 family protein n=1 Tax=Serratia liquefaciens TaxID=614 RepID=UPI0021B7901D|nr:DUF2570 family protein [Serratia liquefaciens]
MTWLANSKVALTLVFIVIGLLANLSVSNWGYRKDLELTRQQVAEQHKTLARQAGLIATLRTQDAQNRALMAAQQQQEQQLRQQHDAAQRKLRDALQNNTCAAERMPDAVIELLHQSAGPNVRAGDKPTP